MTQVVGPPLEDVQQPAVSGPGESSPATAGETDEEATDEEVVRRGGTVSSGGADDRAADEDGVGEGAGPASSGGRGQTVVTAVALFDQGPDDVDAEDGSSPSVHPRLWQRRLTVLGDAGRKRLRWVVAGVSVLAAACVALLVLHTPLLAARQVTVIGAIRTGVGPVVAAVDLHGQPLVDVNPGQVAARVEALPWVAHATVTRHWPNDVTVTVTERVPAAVVDTPGHGAVVVDSHGRVLATDASVAPGMVVLAAPVVPGRPGSILGAGATPGLTVLAAVPAMLEPRLEQVDVADNGDVTLALTGHIGVTLGPAVELPAKFESLVSVLVDVPPTEPEVVDVTVPDAPEVGPPPAPGQGADRLPPPPPAVTVGHPSTAPQTRQVRRGPS